MMNMQTFCSNAAMQEHPLRKLSDFLVEEKRKVTSGDYGNSRFVGYILEIGYTTATIITSDAFKVIVGGIPRNSLLIMVPAEYEKYPPHFSLLRVLETADEPLKQEKQQTYFELHKKSMPELDVFTQSELQWGALKTAVLGMYYPHPDRPNAIELSGDLNNIVSAHKYLVYAPSDELLDLIINATVPQENRCNIGTLRLTECRLPLPGQTMLTVPVAISTNDFKGTRTAMFGKTRTGKSNIVKIIAESVILTTQRAPTEEDTRTHTVGQVIFDINGEYANDNPQDGSASLATAHAGDCQIYAITPKANTPSRPLRLDFYAHPDISHHILNTFIREQERHPSDYISSFLSVEIPSFEQIERMEGRGDQIRARRKILMYWAILHRAGFTPNMETIRELGGVNPGFAQQIRTDVYQAADQTPPRSINTLEELAHELELFTQQDRDGGRLRSTSGDNLFDSDDEALLGFLVPRSRSASGPRKIQRYRIYHDPNAANFVTEIIQSIDQGQTVILDLSNAHPEVMNYFSRWLSEEIFAHQVDLFSSNRLNDHCIQLYFEEAHNLFPADEQKIVDIYSRIAKEGAKYHLGMVYSTQSPSTISRDLLAQTENFFVTHISSRPEVTKLANLNVAYEDLIEDILQTKTQGYVRMLTRSHRFVIPVQANKFAPQSVSRRGG
jgi:DNA helicase HerA-like ATPase